MFKQEKIVSLIAKTKKTIDNDRFFYGSALIEMVELNQVDAVWDLLKAGAKTNWHRTDTANGLLHIAAENNNPVILSALLEYGADEKELNAQQKTAKEVNPECYKKGWLIAEHKRICLTFVQMLFLANCDETCNLYILPEEVLQHILRMGIIYELSSNEIDFNTSRNVAFCNNNYSLFGARNRIKQIPNECLREKKLKEEKIFSESITELYTLYNKGLHFRSDKSIAFVLSVYENRNNFGVANNLITDFLSQRFLMPDYKKTRVDNLLSKLGLDNQELLNIAQAKAERNFELEEILENDMSTMVYSPK